MRKGCYTGASAFGPGAQHGGATTPAWRRMSESELVGPESNDTRGHEEYRYWTFSASGWPQLHGACYICTSLIPKPVTYVPCHTAPCGPPTPHVLCPVLQVIGLAAGEPDFDTPAAIVEAGVQVRGGLGWEECISMCY